MVKICYLFLSTTTYENGMVLKLKSVKMFSSKSQWEGLSTKERQFLRSETICLPIEIMMWIMHLIFMECKFNFCRERYSIYPSWWQKYFGTKTKHDRVSWGGNLSFQDTGLCHSNRKSTTHKSGEISQKYTHKSGEFSENHTHKSGNAKTAHQ